MELLEQRNRGLGKGGTGKTTLAALIIGYLINEGQKPVLAVDADPNSNLDMALGVELPSTIGGVREEMSEKVRKGELPSGVSKQALLEMQIEQSLVETPDFDLISMGRAEGPGCYCAINNMLRVFLDRLGERYRFVVMDNEAGMEHLSRRTTRGVDVMFMVSNPTRRGLETAARIRDLAREMELDIRRIYLVICGLKGPLEGELERAVREFDLNLAGVVPEDEEIIRRELSGEPVVGIGQDSVSKRAVKEIMENVLQGVKK